MDETNQKLKNEVAELKRQNAELQAKGKGIELLVVKMGREIEELKIELTKQRLSTVEEVKVKNSEVQVTPLQRAVSGNFISPSKFSEVELFDIYKQHGDFDAYMGAPSQQQIGLRMQAVTACSPPDRRVASQKISSFNPVSTLRVNSEPSSPVWDPKVDPELQICPTGTYCTDSKCRLLHLPSTVTNAAPLRY